MIRRLLVEARWLAESAGYWIRPYDMLADQRRWRWQPRQRCGWSYGLRADVQPDELSTSACRADCDEIPDYCTSRYGCLGSASAPSTSEEA